MGIELAEHLTAAAITAVNKGLSKTSLSANTNRTAIASYLLK